MRKAFKHPVLLDAYRFFLKKPRNLYKRYAVRRAAGRPGEGNGTEQSGRKREAVLVVAHAGGI